MENTYVVIMAGGVGSRFWPYSTAQKPKQFLDILGLGKSLIRMTFDRFSQQVPHERIFVLTNANYSDLVKNELPELESNQILLEPMMKNTAPCVLYAALKIHQINPEAKLVVVPSDQLILQQDLFSQTITDALNQADDDVLVTIGIQPTRPDTGYGYIEFDRLENTGQVKSVIQFREKPNLALAEQFLASGNFVWNAGIFVWRTAALLHAFQTLKPNLHAVFTEQFDAYGSSGEQDYINRCFELCESISIDYAILEPSKNVKVVLAQFDWSDLGTWGSVYTHVQKDTRKNAKIGSVFTDDTSNCMIRVSPETKAIVVGLEGYVVIEANDQLLIAPLKDEQKIKEWVAELSKQK
jgi:mannose-1-phosphate guanylyltransferase